MPAALTQDHSTPSMPKPELGASCPGRFPSGSRQRGPPPGTSLTLEQGKVSGLCSTFTHICLDTGHYRHKGFGKGPSISEDVTTSTSTSNYSVRTAGIQ